MQMESEHQKGPISFIITEIQNHSKITGVD